MSGINEIQTRIQAIQTRVSTPPLTGQFSSVFEAQMASVQTRTFGASPGTAAAPVEEYMVRPAGFEATVSNYGAETVSLGVMLGLTGPPASVSTTGAVALGAELAQYLQTHAITDRNGRLDPSELTAVSGTWTGTGYLLRPAAGAWEEMRAAAAADGIDLQAIDLYRSWDTQNRAYQAYLSGDKHEQVAPPGTSQHGVGLAVDITNGDIIGVGDPEHAWLRDNATRFGWYPISNESWHWEFRGI